jgi:hypothetical protein
LVLGMEVRRIVIVVEHANQDPEERRDDWHDDTLGLWCRRDESYCRWPSLSWE